MRRLVLMVFFGLAGVSPSAAQFGGGGGGYGPGGGGGGGGFGGGGIYIDAEGVVRASMNRARAKRKLPIPNLREELAARSDLRRISLLQLDRQLRKLAESDESIPLEIEFLAGLVGVEYVLIDRENKDVLIAGPAEGWEYEPDARAVGRSTGRPILHLEDLVSALRCVLEGSGAASCSIDPQAAGLRALEEYDFSGSANSRETKDLGRKIADLYGLQTIRTSGVPEGSRFSLVMIEADYRMKRMALGLEKVSGLTTHLKVLAQLTAKGRGQNRLARWWFTPHYDGIVSNSEGTIFRFEGQAVKILNEEVLIGRGGNRIDTGKSSSDWDKFSDSFTKRFPYLEERYPVYAELHNLFDVMMVAGLIQQQGLASWFSGTAFLDPDLYEVPTREQPRFAEAAAKVIVHGSSGRKFMTWAFGGVSIRPREFFAAVKIQVDQESKIESIPTGGFRLEASKASDPGTERSRNSELANQKSLANPIVLKTSEFLGRWWQDLQSSAK